MATCPAGHSSTATDYCDVCGMPIDAAAPAPAAAATVAAEPQPCPSCGTVNSPDALFCEACGYDYTTGSMPRTAEQPAVPASPGAQPVEAAESAAAESERPDAPATATPETDHALPPTLAGTPTSGGVALEAEVPLTASDAQAAPPAPASGPAEGDQAAEAPTATPALSEPVDAGSSRPVAWVAEVWIDPDWYATQGSTDPLPSPGLPDVVPLRKSSLLVGRVSISRNIHPDVDCELDTGVSRRHAQLTTDGTRWWVEDLESANGTFVGPSSGPLPAMPIPRGRVEVAADQRLYVGAWTRIVIRRATEDEQQAFA